MTKYLICIKCKNAVFEKQCVCAFVLQEMFDATLKDRLQSFDSAPGTTMFLHWLVGMVYVFYFASFILLLREVCCVHVSLVTILVFLVRLTTGQKIPGSNPNVCSLPVGIIEQGDPAHLGPVSEIPFRHVG